MLSAKNILQIPIRPIFCNSTCIFLPKIKAGIELQHMLKVRTDGYDQRTSLQESFNDSRIRTGAPGGIRTPDHLVRSQVLYPTELRAQAQTS